MIFWQVCVLVLLVVIWIEDLLRRDWKADFEFKQRHVNGLMDQLEVVKKKRTEARDLAAERWELYQTAIDERDTAQVVAENLKAANKDLNEKFAAAYREWVSREEYLMFGPQKKAKKKTKR